MTTISILNEPIERQAITEYKIYEVHYSSNKQFLSVEYIDNNGKVKNYRWNGQEALDLIEVLSDDELLLNALNDKKCFPSEGEVKDEVASGEVLSNSGSSPEEPVNNSTSKPANPAN